MGGKAPRHGECAILTLHQEDNRARPASSLSAPRSVLASLWWPTVFQPGLEYLASLSCGFVTHKAWPWCCPVLDTLTCLAPRHLTQGLSPGGPVGSFHSSHAAASQGLKKLGGRQGSSLLLSPWHSEHQEACPFCTCPCPRVLLHLPWHSMRCVWWMFSCLLFDRL